MNALKVLQCSTQDSGGGAETLGLSLHRSYLKRGLDSWLLVGKKNLSEHQVIDISTSPHYNYFPLKSQILQSHTSKWNRFLEQIGYRIKSNKWSHQIMHLTGPRRPDVIQCHNLHGGYFDPYILAPLSQTVPVLLNIHDMWLFTGNCTYSFDCDRWETGCGFCPHMDLPPRIPFDWTHHHWKMRRQLFKHARFHLSCASEWIANKVRRSILMPAVQEIRIIPNSVDCTTFTPGKDKSAVRRKLNLPEDCHIVFCAANLGEKNPYKDTATMLRALRHLERCKLSKPIRFIILGGEQNSIEAFSSVSIQRVSHIKDRALMARYFQASDLTWHLSKQEIFGIVIIESMACATPVIASRTGGIPEIIQHGINGLLVREGNPTDLVNATLGLLKAPEYRSRISRNALASVREKFDRKIVIDQYIQWLRELTKSGDFARE